MELLNYFYHPNYTSTELSTSLGSSSWITDNTGRPIQHLHYLPFGEDWVDQRTTSWNTPYTFSGKEKDVETGYGYFGARYYDSGLSIWLSVDPMSDKYPSMSPYNYCANNPVMLVDPDGREVIVFGSESEAYVKQLQTKNLTITRNNETGKLSYEGIAKTDEEKQMVSAIDNTEVTVNICAKNTNKVNGSNSTHNGGAFLGTEYIEYSDGTKQVETFQQVNPHVFNKMERDINADQGMYARHELTESFEAGLISLNNKKSSPEAGKFGSVYEQAHNKASFAFELIKTEKTYALPSRNIFDPTKYNYITIPTYQIDQK